MSQSYVLFSANPCAADTNHPVRSQGRRPKPKEQHQSFPWRRPWVRLVKDIFLRCCIIGGSSIATRPKLQHQMRPCGRVLARFALVVALPILQVTQKERWTCRGCSKGTGHHFLQTIFDSSFRTGLSPTAGHGRSRQGIVGCRAQACFVRKGAEGERVWGLEGKSKCNTSTRINANANATTTNTTANHTDSRSCNSFLSLPLLL